MSTSARALRRLADGDTDMSTPLHPHLTTGFYIQAMVSFGASITAVGRGIACPPVSTRVRAS
jgi:hypothetical protein